MAGPKHPWHIQINHRLTIADGDAERSHDPIPPPPDLPKYPAIIAIIDPA
jgi:hypothetical protein